MTDRTPSRVREAVKTARYITSITDLKHQAVLDAIARKSGARHWADFKADDSFRLPISKQTTVEPDAWTEYARENRSRKAPPISRPTAEIILGTASQALKDGGLAILGLTNTGKTSVIRHIIRETKDVNFLLIGIDGDVQEVDTSMVTMSRGPVRQHEIDNITRSIAATRPDVVVLDEVTVDCLAPIMAAARSVSARMLLAWHATGRGDAIARAGNYGNGNVVDTVRAMTFITLAAAAGVNILESTGTRNTGTMHALPLFATPEG